MRKKKIILYGRRNTALICLPYLVAKGYELMVVSDDENVLWAARQLGCEIRELENALYHEYDLFICIHGNKIIPKEAIREWQMINIHPCLTLGYKGTNPVKRYIENKQTIGSVSSHYIIEEVDAGEIIHTEVFATPVCERHSDFYNVALSEYLRLLDKTLEILNV